MRRGVLLLVVIASLVPIAPEPAADTPAVRPPLAANVLPDPGSWYGQTDPYGAFGFEVLHVRRRLYNVRRFHLVSTATCTTGQTLGFNLKRNVRVGVDTGRKRPAFGVHWHMTGIAEGVQGDVYIEVSAWGRFISHRRATGGFDAELQTTDPRWGYCEVEDGAWEATGR